MAPAAARALLSKKLAIALARLLTMLCHIKRVDIVTAPYLGKGPVDSRGDALPATTRKVCPTPGLSSAMVENSSGMVERPNVG